jgi:hypothetical protein
MVPSFSAIQQRSRAWSEVLMNCATISATRASNYPSQRYSLPVEHPVPMHDPAHIAGLMVPERVGWARAAHVELSRRLNAWMAAGTERAGRGWHRQ